MARALVLRAPGINCDRETAYACRLAGFETDLVHINFLRKTPERLLDYAFFVIPGGFSYGDDLGAGTLLAKNLSVHLSKQLHQFIDEGRLLLGICNGFQVLVRAGLLPGHSAATSWAEARTDARSPSPCLSAPVPTISDIPLCSLSDNASAQFECRWVTLSVEPGVCIFTRGIERCIQLPVAHGEGRFVLSDTAMLARLQANGQIPLMYAKNSQCSCRGGSGAEWNGLSRVGFLSTETMETMETMETSVVPQGSLPHPTPLRPYGHDDLLPKNLPLREWSGGACLRPNRNSAGVISYPDNPNGSIGGIAGICNTQGNVFGLMPHPERYVNALQHPQRRGTVEAGVERRDASLPPSVGELASAQGQGDGLLIFKNAYAYARKRERKAR